jgi:peptide/nickel transport system permease protein
VSFVDSLKIVLRRNWRRLRQTWKLYKRSKIGLIGLTIMIGFVVVAVFAPIIAPYDPMFAAPNEDVFAADFTTQSLNATGTGIQIDSVNETWHEPVLKWMPPPESNLVSILAYSSQGHAIRYDVDFVSIESGAALGIEVTLDVPPAFIIPQNTSFMEYVYFRSEYYMAIADSTYWELTFDDLTPKREVNIGFAPVYLSNLWWIPRSAEVVQDEIVCFAMANETTLFLTAKAHPGIGEFTERFFVSSKQVSVPDSNMTDLKIIGDPIIILDANFDNDTLLIVPTNKALLAYKIDISINIGGLLPGLVNDVTIGDLFWYVDYQAIGDTLSTTINPVEKHTIAVENPGPRKPESKDRIVLASNPGGDEAGNLFSFWTANGTFNWWTTVTVPEMRSGFVDGVYPSDRRGFLVTAWQAPQGLVAGIEGDTGRIRGGVTHYSLVEGRVVSIPQFVQGNRRYILSTDQDKVYMLRENVKSDIVFSIEKGILVPVIYIGNIMTEQQIAGNYYSIITGEPALFVQSLTGSYIAPLPPGVGASGNVYILGTDVFGHDIFTQLVYGTQNELIVGLTAAFIAVSLGTLIGMVAGYFGGIVDSILMRFTDIFLTLPILVIALLLASVLGPSLFNLIIVIAVFSWAGLSRVIRAQTLSIKERDFIKAAKVAGAGHRQILFRHLAPNVLPFTFLYMAYIISGAIVTEAILSFLGMGDPTSITWGMMLQYLRISGHTLDAPWWFLPPGIAITLLSLSFYLIGRAFDEVVNPRLRAR